MDLGRVFEMYKEGLLLVESGQSWTYTYTHEHMTNIVICEDRYFSIYEVRTGVPGSYVYYSPIVKEVERVETTVVQVNWVATSLR